MAKTRYKKPESLKKFEDFAFKKKVEANPSFPYPVKTRYSDRDTNSLTKCVQDCIELTGGFVERVNSTGMLLKTKDGERWVKGSSRAGTSDLHALIKGVSVKIEIKCKYTNDRQSEAQKQYQRDIERAGGIYVIVRDFTEFTNWYRKFLREHK
ncbi:hypothetical protein BST97_12115 [Nonlabens spongiae]|uniref:VRR-NUC domain-containing protein n=1 Tax=Nonlabens spongiae TaxID=331648 RepID=A0A1W6MM65_9FLAO|nr:hypothetical protein [Nonlabens spongiae]ARN78675.1 hypothetical protein BST97_12115 [Nonlabens spongiae]